MHRRWVENLPGKLEIWLILHNTVDRHTLVAGLGHATVTFQYISVSLNIWQPNWRLHSFKKNSRFVMNGGQINRMYVSRLADLSATDFEAVFNCTGLGAKQLCNDRKIVPIRGQVVKGRLKWTLTRRTICLNVKGKKNWKPFSLSFSSCTLVTNGLLCRLRHLYTARL